MRTTFYYSNETINYRFTENLFLDLEIIQNLKCSNWIYLLNLITWWVKN